MASTYLSRTQSTGNRQIFTYSLWVKRSTLGNRQRLIRDYNSSTAIFQIYFESSNDTLFVLDYTDTNPNPIQIRTNQVFRDPSAWYHIVVSIDTTQATSSNRVKIYVNGSQVTSFAEENYPSQNFNSSGNQSGNTLYIGSTGSGDYFDGSMAHVHFIDGTAYDASAFGETDATTGIWKPKTAPSVTYGTNGFFLKFENSGAFGTDSSGNANNFTVNGTMTQTIDTPSNVFATWNSVFSLSGTLSNGNNTYATADAYGSLSNTATSTLGVSSGKYYAEFKCGATTGSFPNGMVGVYYNPEKFQNGATNPAQSDDEGFGYAENGNIYNNSSTSTGTTYTNGDIIGIALDLDGNKVYWYKNGTLVNTGGTTIDAGETYFFFVADTSGSGGTTYQANFGNGYFGTTAVTSAQNPDDGIGIFEYSVPTGYKALCTKSINAQEYS